MKDKILKNSESIFRTIPIAFNPFAYNKLSIKTYKECSKYFFKYLLLGLILISLLLIPRLIYLQGTVTDELSKFNTLSVDVEHEMNGEVSLPLGNPLIKIDTRIDELEEGSELGKELFFLTGDYLYKQSIKPFSNDVSRFEIEPYKNILANKDFSSKLLIIVVGLMLPGLLIVSYVFLTIKYLVMTFIAGVLGLIIVRLFRFEISFNEILKSALFATSPFIILDIIRMVFSLNFYFMHYLIYVVFLSLVIVRIGEFGDREAMSAKRKKKGREKGGNDFVEVDDIKWDKF